MAISTVNILFACVIILFLHECDSISTKPGSKILLSPYIVACNSRLRNMLKIGDYLTDAGYDVHIIISDTCAHMKEGHSYRFQEFTTSAEVKEVEEQKVKIMHQVLQGNLWDLLSWLRIVTGQYCEGLVQHPGFLSTLKQENYDLIIYDQIDLCSLVLLGELDVPSVFYSNHGWVEPSGFILPSHISYIPFSGSDYPAEMTYVQRMTNVALYTGMYLYKSFMLEPVALDLREKYGLNTDLAAYELERKPSLLFVNSHFTFDFIRPTFPNVILIGGIHNRPSKSLDKEMEAFYSQAKHGVIIVAFGTNELQISDELLHHYLRAFARRKESIVWKYAFPLPQAPPANTKVVSWIAQNDLLGHPKTKLFISHCGVSSMHETVFHGVPIVAIPGLGDQFHNAARLVGKLGIGKKLNFFEVTEDSLHDSIEEVISNDVYHNIAKRASEKYRNQEVDPKSRFLYWVDHMIKYKEAAHLSPRAALQQTWYQYFMLDVFVLPIVVIGFVFYFGKDVFMYAILTLRTASIDMVLTILCGLALPFISLWRWISPIEKESNSKDKTQ